MFGHYEEKELQGMPKTFVPRDDGLSARNRKLDSLVSAALPRTQSHAAPDGNCSEYAPSQVRVRSPGYDLDADEMVNTSLRRQQEMQSQVFGRSAPLADQAERPERLMATDLKWHAHSENKGQNPEMQHSQRAFQEKCSVIFDRQSPQTFDAHNAVLQEERQAREDEDARRRTNAYYSDLFGRSAPAEDCNQHVEGDIRHKPHASLEDQVVVHPDWTNSKTELLGGRAQRPEHPALRKSEELHKVRVFGRDPSDWQASTERAGPVTHDNSSKVKQTLGRSTQEIHQAHLRTSIVPEPVDQDGESCTQWEVRELHISGLSPDADDEYVRGLCNGFDLQIVKAQAEMDPVRNRCQGRAKVVVRYNPVRESIDGLVSRFASSKLKVEA